MTSIDIPRDAKAAVDILAEAGSLITAKEWQRACIVAALLASEIHTPKTLAKVGIVGMTTVAAVERYRQAWTEVRPAPALGQHVDLDNLPEWPADKIHARLDSGDRRRRIEDEAAKDGVGVGSAIRVAESRKAVVTVVKADEEMALAIAENVEAFTAILRAERKTRRAKAQQRNLTRNRKQREAAEEAAGPKALVPQQALNVIWAMHSFREAATECARDSQSLEVMRLVREALATEVGFLDAIIAGDLLPMADDDFEDALHAMLGESS